MSGSSLVVLTQNAWGGAPLWAQRREILARAIAAIGADVVGLQEIHAERDASRSAAEAVSDASRSTAEAERDASRSAAEAVSDASRSAAEAERDAHSQAHDLAELAGGYDAWFAPGRVTATGHCEGVALLVKRGLAVVSRGGLSLSLDSSDPIEGPHQRVVLSASIACGGGVVDVHCTHLSLSKRARERTLAELVAFAAKERERSGSGGAVLVGDFNATPGEPALATLEAAGWVDAWKHAGHDAGEARAPGAAGRGGTWPAGLPFRRIDYVWVQPGAGWQIVECVRTPVSGSDHVGLVARLHVPAAAR